MVATGVSRMILRSLVLFLSILLYFATATVARAQTWGPIPGGDFDATTMASTQQQPMDLSGAADGTYVAELTNFGYQIYFKTSHTLVESWPIQTFGAAPRPCPDALERHR